MACRRPEPQARSLNLRRWRRSSSPEPGPWPWAPTQAPGPLAQRKGRRNPTCNPSDFEGLQVGLRLPFRCAKGLGACVGARGQGPGSGLEPLRQRRRLRDLAWGPGRLHCITSAAEYTSTEKRLAGLVLSLSSTKNVSQNRHTTMVPPKVEKARPIWPVSMVTYVGAP